MTPLGRAEEPTVGSGRITVITDSAAAMPSDVAQQLAIGVVPIVVTAGGRVLRDGELSDEELLALDDISSAAPAPGAFVQAIAERADATGAVVVTVSGALSGTHQAATIAAGVARIPTLVVDSGSAAGGQALVAHAAARCAAAGGSLDEVAAVARSVAERVNLVGALSSLTQLVRSGRVPGLAGRAGDALGLRPLFDIRGGRVRRLRPAGSDPGADERILTRWRSSRPRHPIALHVVAMHAGAPRRAERLLDAVTDGADVPLTTAFVGRFGQAMVANSGLGVCGLAWWWEVAAS